MKLTLFDNSNNIIKEDFIEADENDQFFWQNDLDKPTTQFGDEDLKITMTTNNHPEKHVPYFNKIVEKIRQSKLSGEKTRMLVNREGKEDRIYTFEWRNNEQQK